MIRGETLGYRARGFDCTSCGENMQLKVMSTPAGHYLGYGCPSCGPVSRETGYMNETSAKGLLALSHEAGFILGRRR